MKTMNRFAVAFAILVVTGCAPPTAEQEQARATEQLQAEAQAQVGMPDVFNWTEKRQMKDILELRDQPELSTFTYVVNMDGDLRPLCQSIGYGLPYSVQYTNPAKIARTVAGNRFVLPQADPNGLYMPSGLSATWVLCANPVDGSIEPVYVEPSIIVSRFELNFGGWAN